MDDKKKKKLDGKRIALSQKHERTYLLKSAKKWLKIFEIDKESLNNEERGLVGLFEKNGCLKLRKTTSLMRLLKALIKILEKR
jgi:hypothetical protein